MARFGKVIVGFGFMLMTVALAYNTLASNTGALLTAAENMTASAAIVALFVVGALTSLAGGFLAMTR
jgi:mannose/fructose/N-acetylgalactosamine-specific phosphotransferase system component IID